VLYPISRLLQNIIASDFGQTIGAAASESAFVLAAVTTDGCDSTVASADRIQTWSSTVMKIGVVTTIIGKVFNALGHTEIEAQAGVAGFAGGTLKSSRPKKIAEVLDGLGTILDKVRRSPPTRRASAWSTTRLQR
jgi:hypothetical protein